MAGNKKADESQLFYFPVFRRSLFLRTVHGSQVLGGFDLHDHVDASFMAAALELGIDPFINDHLGQFHAYHTGAESDDVGVVMLLGELCCERLTAHAGADALHLVGCQTDAYAGTADKHTAVYFAVSDHLRDLISADRIIEAAGCIGPDVDDLDPSAFLIGLDLILILDCHVNIAIINFIYHSPIVDTKQKNILKTEFLII